LHGRGYGLTDPEALVVVKEARHRAATEIRSMVKYLTGMAEDEHGNPKPDLAVIIEAVQISSEKSGGFRDERTYEPAGVQPDQPTYQPPPYTPPAVEAKPVSEIPSADPLAGLTNEELRDWMHVNLGCKTLNCERCWRVRESGQHPMFPATNMDTVPPMQESA
jgi:hypothetical protein